MSAVDRRIKIINILSKEGEMGVAEVIDALREFDEYKNLNKKSHMTQIKLDLEYLREANLVGAHDYNYFLVYDLFEK